MDHPTHAGIFKEFEWKNGRGERIRTSDPLVPNQVLYQAEPLPELAVGKDVYELKGPWPSPS